MCNMGYKGLQVFTKGYGGLNEVTWVTKGYRG